MQLSDPGLAAQVEQVIPASIRFAFIVTNDADAAVLRNESFQDFGGKPQHVTIMKIERVPDVDKLSASVRHDVSPDTLAALSAAVGAPCHLLADVIKAEPLVLAAIYQDAHPFNSVITAHPNGVRRMLESKIQLPPGTSFTDPRVTFSIRADNYTGRRYESREGVRGSEVLHFRRDEAGISARLEKQTQLRAELEVVQKSETHARSAEKAASVALESANAELAVLNRKRKQYAEAEGKLVAARKV